MKKMQPAFTLVELLTTLTVGSTLMVLAVNLVHQTMLLSQTARDKVQRLQTTNLFVDQWRREIHAAQSVEVNSDQEVTINLQDDLPVIYKIVEHQLIRLRQAVNGVTERDALQLGERTNCQFEMLLEPQRVALTLESQLDGPDFQRRIDRRVEAVVGRTRQH